MNEDLRTAAQLIRNADGLIVAAGAGMGVDSGLPDFRGPQGFWKAYPALGRAGIAFTSVASPTTFERDPTLAWGFYGHRLKLYRDTAPHAGFGLLREMATRTAHGAFVFTSNVDGQFQKAGFDANRVIECHGSIHFLQCLGDCGDIWSARSFGPEIDMEECRLISPLPRCPACTGIARPNILMFGDWGWVDTRQQEQYARYARWRKTVKKPVVIEIGAGTDIPSVRHFTESQRCPLIRINPREPEVPGTRDVGIACGALDALRELNDRDG